MATYRVVYHTKKGQIVHRDFKDLKSIQRAYNQVGVDDTSCTLRLHGEPVFKGLIGPMSEGRRIIRYETPGVFEVLTAQVYAEAAREAAEAK